MDDEDGGLFNISISDDEKPQPKPSRRTDQSESEWQAVKSTYHVKIENGELHKAVILPLGPNANKQHVQQALHAVEELYFFRRYKAAADLSTKILEQGGLGESEADTKDMLASYRLKCQHKLTAASC